MLKELMALLGGGSAQGAPQGGDPRAAIMQKMMEAQQGGAPPQPSMDEGMGYNAGTRSMARPKVPPSAEFVDDFGQYDLMRGAPGQGIPGRPEGGGRSRRQRNSEAPQAIADGSDIEPEDNPDEEMLEMISNSMAPTDFSAAKRKAPRDTFLDDVATEKQLRGRAEPEDSEDSFNVATEKDLRSQYNKPRKARSKQAPAGWEGAENGEPTEADLAMLRDNPDEATVSSFLDTFGPDYEDHVNEARQGLE